MESNNITRRGFLKIAGAGGLGVVWRPETADSAQTDPKKHLVVPTRPFGHTGMDVSILSLGGMFDIRNNQLMLAQALRMGVTYWDTAHIYGNGNSEIGFGRFFKRYPHERKKIFLVTKSPDHDPEGMTHHLDLSLERMHTGYIDLFFMHALRNTRPLTGKVRAWAAKQKAAGKIRLFGFSTHRNMEKCLFQAAQMSWIDGIMMTYNYRLMHKDGMRAAVEACAQAGIGLTAMKTQGGGQIMSGSQEEMALGGRFLEKGFSNYQAKLKAVWENPHIAAICSQMPNMTILMANTAAAVNKTRLTEADLRHLTRHAASTAPAYCAGCGDICETALGADIPIADVMRYLMYAENYDDRERAMACFQRLPEQARRRLATADFGKAEHKCPQNMPIGRLMHSAIRKLAQPVS